MKVMMKDLKIMEKSWSKDVGTLQNGAKWLEVRGGNSRK